MQEKADIRYTVLCGSATGHLGIRKLALATVSSTQVSSYLQVTAANDVRLL